MSWRPDGMAMRLALVLAAALLAANVVALALLALERDRLGREAQLESALERIVDLVPQIEAEPNRARRVLRRTERRTFSVRLARQPSVGPGPTDDRAQRVAVRIAEALERNGTGARIVRADIGERPAGRLGVRGGRPRLLLSIGLEGAAAGSWLNASVRVDPPRAQGPRAFLLIVGLSLFTVLGVAILYVRRMVRPLGELAAAARAAGKGDRTARVPEHGAHEIREAAAAFNDMQARIALFDEERTRTLAAVGHDLRTPITSLRIRAEMLDDEAREPMVRTLDEMKVMADGLVSYARGEGDGEPRERIDLAPWLERLCAERGARWHGGHAPAVDVRPVALTRAVGNLIDNALRYAGTAEVRLSTDAGQAVIAVMDEGPGIEPERLPTVVEPFVRGEGSRSTETGGAGLGLSIARKVLLAHGGELRLANRPTGGLLAEARLPLPARSG